MRLIKMDVIQFLSPHGFKVISFGFGKVWVLEETGGFLLKVKTSDGVTHDGLLKSKRKVRFRDEEGFSVLKGVSGLESASIGGVWDQNALEDFSDLALAEVFNPEES